ncbi:SDR family NAD(P)-dependent oxidoreductase [Pseudomaricurvus sp. HS19]|uniref:SDR family NAD(P)-dependent oxidoreductase n=1 Tax=Pseudomaricurvus sp. HS19 TaxID=2692626 RepID=UPI001371464C|nr:SDR family NAD(P)-dependent oxidoreductase [Pseudomaricurvus sp. HS19]MYM62938.1 SDR family NAD(P)-dependent oxidoreductase [Pseudomaricurvus sp. HS19]
MDIQGKTAIVTGGASGLGRATVELYASKGANVAIFDMNEELGTQVASELGDNVAFFKVDVSSEESVQAGINGVMDKFGALHIVNNYAGIGPACKTYGKKGPHPLDLYMKIVMINQVGTFNVARLAAEQIAKNEPVNEDGCRGVIINTASVAAFEGQIGQVAYSATKGAVVGMTLPMARELEPYGIRVNTIAPGLIHTPLFDTIEESYYKALEASTVFPRRLGKTAEIAKLALHIVENDYMNGETVRLDAAIRMQPK